MNSKACYVSLFESFLSVIDLTALSVNEEFIASDGWVMMNNG